MRWRRFYRMARQTVAWLVILLGLAGVCYLAGLAFSIIMHSLEGLPK